MQESVFAIVIVFFFLLPLDAVSAQKGFAVNRAFDGIFLALFIEKYVAAQQSGHETGFLLDDMVSCYFDVLFYLSENVTGTIIRAATGGLGKGLACLMAWRAASSREA